MKNIPYPFSTYNRFLAFRRPMKDSDVEEHNRKTCLKYIPTEVANSLLGLFAAGESRLMSSFVAWSEGDGTTYG